LDIFDFGKKPPKNVVFWKASYNKARNLRRRFLPKAPLLEEPFFGNLRKKGNRRLGKAG
jgi:hypothetical protein